MSLNRNAAQQLARCAAATLLLVLTLPTHAAPSAKLWAEWEPHNNKSKIRVDHSAWQSWLDSYLVTQPNGATAVRYQQVTAADRTQLDTYVTQLTSLDPLDLNRAEQFAYWVNLYNALTVQVVLAHPGEDSIMGMGSGWFNTGPWDEKLADINGKPVTLNDIEHRILRPIWQDHRIHYVVNCASISCPNLSVRAFTATNTESQMAEAEATYLSQAKGVSVDDRGRLVLSKIFQWYRDDFAKNDAGLENYLGSRLSQLPQAQVTADQLSTAFGSRRYAYDWGLNSAQ